MAIVRRIFSVVGEQISCNTIETSMKKQLVKLKQQHKANPERVQQTSTGKIIVKTDDGMRTEYSLY